MTLWLLCSVTLCRQALSRHDPYRQTVINETPCHLLMVTSLRRCRWHTSLLLNSGNIGVCLLMACARPGDDSTLCTRIRHTEVGRVWCPPPIAPRHVRGVMSDGRKPPRVGFRPHWWQRYFDEVDCFLRVTASPAPCADSHI